MHYRPLGRTGMNVSVISFGAWAIGGFWGAVDDLESMRALHAAIDAGVNFIDTADVYGDGRSERLVAQLKRERPGETIWVTTKAGRRLERQTVEGYSRENLTAWIDRSLANLETDAIDLLQLHCPPRAVYDRPEVFGVLDDLVSSGKLRHYGVSVETVDEGLAALAYPRVQSVQIIFNMFRLKPAEQFLGEAARRGVGIIARVPLASGLLTGRITRETTFAEDDHRTFNRHGEMFDVGETFSGVPLEAAFTAVEDLRPLVPAGRHPGAACAAVDADVGRCQLRDSGRTDGRAGSRRTRAAADLPAISPETMTAVERVYDAHVRRHVHGKW